MSRKVIVNGESICYLPPVDASEINYNNTTVKDAIDELTTTVEQALDNVLYKNEEDPTIKGALIVDRHNGTASDRGSSTIILGNDIPEGTDGNSKGNIYLYSNNDKYIRLYPPNDLNNNRNIQLPSYAGTLARIEDVNEKKLYCKNYSTGDTNAINITFTQLSRYGLIIFGGFNGGAAIGAIDMEASGPSTAFYHYHNGTHVDLNISWDSTTNVATISGFPKWSTVTIASSYNIN